MKKLFVISLIFFGAYCASAMGASGPARIASAPLSPPAVDSSDNAVCDSFNHIFFTATDTFKSLKGAWNKSGNFYTPYSKIPGAKSAGVFSSFYMSCYDFSADSAKEFELYDNLIKAVKVCLTNGPAKEVEHTFVRETDNPRELLYTYTIKELKPGYDKQLLNWCVKLEFVPKVGADGKPYDFQLFISIARL